MIELLWNDPVSEAKMSEYIDILDGSSWEVLDVGCGCGEILLRIHERFGVSGVGIDRSLPHIEEARRRAVGRADAGAIRFEVADVETWPVEPASLDLVICMGSTHAFGLGSDAYRNALSQMILMLKPGGVMMVGDGYMKRPASPEYRKLLGDDMPDEQTHANNVFVAQEMGLITVAAHTSSLDEWDTFEWGYQQILERKAGAGDKDALKRLASRREWLNGYLRYGRDTLGYGVYLFRKP